MTARLSDGLMDIILKEDAEHPRNKHRGFAFADYSDHKLASGAMKRLLAPGTLVFNKNLHAEWAEPLNEVTEEQMAKVSATVCSSELTSLWFGYIFVKLVDLYQ